MARIGILPLGRSTFDVAFAEDRLEAALAGLDATGHGIVGPRELLLDADAARTALRSLEGGECDLVLILQVTFTDASMSVEIAETAPAPLAIWAFPEPRAGGRLRLNAFCGLNLAAHALGLRDIPFSWLYQAPEAPGLAPALDDMLAGGRQATPVAVSDAAAYADSSGRTIVDGLDGTRIGRIGVHPDGFDTCAYETTKLQRLAGVSVEPIELAHLFDCARVADDTATAAVRREAENALAGVDAVDQAELDRSLRLKVALDRIRADRDYDAFAVRCWPETFTEYGGAGCGPVAMMGEAGVPCACEADVYGALTSLILQRSAGTPAFLVDLVDLDADDDTGVVWHCGQAPISMADPDFVPRATVHSNRKMPLLFEFPLKPGRVTFARVSQARGTPKMVIGGGEVLSRPMAFTGTSGVVRFDKPAAALADTVMNAALEHHLALVYGEHRGTLRSVAAALKLPILEL